ncbi:MAG TPA: alpha-amylase family glycosyl hydrolase [Syntrophorhabdaceae bacterium]|nr:alpha-amylase family glycosyl hydrolase [Syntrophorhabdaceae bacterium]
MKENPRKPAHSAPTMEFHVSRRSRDFYRFSEALFSLSGNVIFTNFYAARVFAQKINEKKDLISFPEGAVKAGQLIAMGLIDEILHYVARQYRNDINKKTMAQALSSLNERLGRENVEGAMHHFVDAFPPLRVYKNEVGIADYLNGNTEGIPNRQIVLEEMLLLWLANMNPAFSPFFELFDDVSLKKETAYLQIISGLVDHFHSEPPFGPDHQGLVDMLRSPALAVPHSLSGQLAYIMERWGFLLRKYLPLILKSLDLFKEEQKLPFMGAGPSEVARLKELGLELEPEHFTPDSEWMPRLVLIAKNIYVWLDQLSKKYQRHITRLDGVPDEELDALQKRGITGLWLIGVWERSPASQKIKQLCGNPEAVPSAYSLYDYIIASDLGGDEAFNSLRERAWERGIRLASDMVPNHVGIYSRWMTEHPDWFISLDQNPFPWYAYGGLDLSHDERVSIFIEDHYYERTDAAVVFKRRDRWTGDEKYVYHGNDGTSMPWNDTAQLNYLNPEVREAMINTIIAVAKRFPIIRFDAAMTLTKRHYQRLWFPEPGTGGAIPTRVEHGLTKHQFNSLMPNEFWREVVDRVAQEAPDTLLLAEAFWLLEGYFVRTLGMHRVYNSAFMNMLRDEENAKYRQVMKNTLEFDPEILRRFVNFMNNPDERTAVDQFGKNSKYFGVCTLMITLPGLPMFGHGQIEGFTEKYGMEYRRAYWEEEPDGYLIERHEREIFPLLHKRYLFAGVEHFLLYDFFTPDGHVSEDVFAYSNRYGSEKSLVVYNNKNAPLSGWIRTSVGFAVKGGDMSQPALAQKTLSEGLGISGKPGHFTIFSDHATGLQYIRESGGLAEKGLYIELGPYQHHVFLDIAEIEDNAWSHYAQLNTYLNGLGVPNIDDAIREIFLQPIHQSFKELINVHMLKGMLDAKIAIALEQIEDIPAPFLDEIRWKTTNLVREIRQFANGTVDEGLVVENVMNALLAALHWQKTLDRITGAGEEDGNKFIGFLRTGFFGADHHALCQLNWVFVRSMGKVIDAHTNPDEQGRSWIDEWLLGRIMGDALQELGFAPDDAYRGVVAVKIFTGHQHWFSAAQPPGPYQVLTTFLNDSEVQGFLQINRYKDILWFNKDAFELLLAWMAFTAMISIASDPARTENERDASLAKCFTVLSGLYEASERSGYQVENLLEIVRQNDAPRP